MHDWLIKAAACLLACAPSAAASSLQQNAFHLAFSPALQSAHDARRIPAFHANAAALTWKQIGSTNYVYGYPGDSSWDFQSRDTMMYDAAGVMALRKTSAARSGWSMDSLDFVDSLSYGGPRLIDEYQCNYGGGTIRYGTRNSFTYSNDGKTIVVAVYNWSQLKNGGELFYKDSVISSMISNGEFYSQEFSFQNLRSITEINAFNYDTSGPRPAWKLDQSLKRIDSECTATKMVFGGKGPGDFQDTGLTDIKQIITDTGFIEQVKNPSTDGYATTVKEIFYKDSHHNDTLHTQWSCTTAGLECDSGKVRYARTYDARSNNVETVIYDFDAQSGSWRKQGKSVNIFAVVNSPIIDRARTMPLQKNAVASAAGGIRFLGSDITGLNVYDFSGRLAASIQQHPAPSLLLNVSKVRLLLPSGAYIAEITGRNGKNFYTISLQH